MRQSFIRSSLLSSIAPAFVLGLGTFIAACSPHDSATGSSSGPSASDVAEAARASEPAVTSRDATGQSKFMWAGRGASTAIVKGAVGDIARAQLAAHARVLGFSKAAATTAILAREQRFPGGGGVISFEQKVGDIPVFRTRASVILDKTNNLVAISGSLRPVAEGGKAPTFTLTPEQALARAYEARFGTKLDTSSITDVGLATDGQNHAYRVRTPAGGARLMGTAKVRKVLVPQKGKLVAAYHAEFVGRAAGSRTNDAWLFAIAADDGRTLVKNSLTSFETFNYRVWAETGAASQHGIPTDSPLADSTPLAATVTPTSAKEGAFGPTALVAVDGFNKNPAGTPDPWLPATATETKGNNVDGYTDRNSADDDAETGDGFEEGIDFRANTTAARTFDRSYDPTKQPNQTNDQMKAAVTQLFYVNNWMHDYWYDSGFDEKAGNAQASNYGRGGEEGDVLLAEAQDGADVGLSSNANMSTPSDGSSPRMQMYVWSGASTAALTTSPAVPYTDGVNPPDFGPQTFNATGGLVAATPADGCTALTNNVTGKIVIIDRGTCSFVEKVKIAQNAGAVGVLLANNAPGHTPVSAGGADPTITIPTFGMSQEDGVLLKTAAGAGTVTATMKRTEEILRDGTIDNTVVAHEWGHYLHHRLVDCGSQQCSGMSEGWADFNALMMVIKATDTLDGTVFPLSQYATVSPYYGIRRAPYSSDTAKNPFTFKSIRADYVIPPNVPVLDFGDNTESHNVGEIWAQTLFEAYTNLLRDTKGTGARLTFEQAKRRMADYIVAGMKATPTEPTFTEQRDAVLAVAYAADAKDFLALSKGFAKRGMGVGAVSPPIDSEDFNETVEDFSTKGNLDFVDAKIDDAVRSCDRDGFLDADEKGDATIRVRNGGWENLASTTVTITTTAPGVTFGNGGKGTVASVDPFGIVKIRIPVSYDAAATKQQFVPIKVTLSNAASLKATVDGAIEPRANFDVKDATIATDDVESPKPVWTFTHGIASAPNAWERKAKTDPDGKPVTPPDYHWVGADLGTPSDESLVSPSLTVGSTAPFVITFKHKYQFEFGPAGRGQPDVAFDGAVLEVSEDNGATWKDVTAYGGTPGYTQTIHTNDTDEPTSPDNNPLAGRLGYGGTLATVTPVTVNLGTSLAGKTVKVRFRVASDPASGDTGWEIDDIGFTGITNQPFATLVDDASVCAGVPIPVPGAPQTVAPGTKVALDASGSSDPDGDPITFAWEQLDGPEVKLDDPTTQAKTGFTAPDVTEETKLLFRVTVADAKQAASDTVEITVKPAPEGGTGGADGGEVGNPGTPTNSDDNCSCRTVGGQQNAGFGAASTLLAGVVALVLRGRRKSGKSDTKAK